MIIVKGLKKSYYIGDLELPVLRGIDMHVEKGEFVAVTGRSGSGKSTLLYQLGLLDVPNEGSITIDGLETSELSSAERTQLRLIELGYVFQDYALLPSLTALENVVVPLLMLGLSMKEARKKAIHSLTKVGLSERINNLPNQLSGGEQQRVSIARAIGFEPKILFADEPTANLDTETSKMVLDTFLELNAAGQTIVMVTHEKDYAELADRIFTLSDGIISSEKKGKK
jgi:putative ABC transport system ATP-binding protein